MLALVSTLVFTACVCTDDPVAPKEPPKKEVLSAISERGRMLYAYDHACWHASDALVAIKPKEGTIRQYIARKTDAGWVVSFGRLDAKTDRFLVAYVATENKDGKGFAVRECDPPKEDDGFLRSAAKAIGTAVEDFQGEQRPHNVAVLPAENEQFWVYIFPAATKPRIWPLGGDARFKVSADGAKIVEKRQLHKTVIEIERPEQDADEKLVGGIHSHVLSDLPEDTDVFHVLTRKPAVPEYITTEHFAYEIGVDGAIEFRGTIEEFVKNKK